MFTGLMAAFLLLVAIMTPSLVWGQSVQDEMISLSDWLAQPTAEREPSYLHIRCAAIYQGIANYTGQERLGSKTFKNYEKAVELNSMQALLLRQNTLPSTPLVELSKGVARDRNALSVMYNDRMHKNYQRTGWAAFKDPLMSSDLNICRTATERLAAKQSN